MNRIICVFICFILISCSKDNNKNQLDNEFIQCESRYCKIFESNINDSLINETEDPILLIEFYSEEKTAIKAIQIRNKKQFSGISVDSLGRVKLLSSKGNGYYFIKMSFDSLGNYKDLKDSIECCYGL
jgi:hypothetical protein